MAAHVPRSHVIRKIPITHCARGPRGCARCREVARTAICLLDVNPSRAHLQARPVIPVTIDGVKVFRPYDVVREFASPDEARAFAAANGVADVILDDD